jgi:sulfotransferase family protein
MESRAIMRYPLFLIRQLGRTVSKKVVRTGARHLPFLPKERTRRLERWLRGREDWRKLRLADAVVVSFGKSGRTWLRVLLSRVFQLQHGLDERAILGFDNLHYRTGAAPKILFTHDNYLKDYTGRQDSKADFYGKKVIFLARDPRDVAVSQYFQWKYRMKPNKKDINAYPIDDLAPFDFAMSDAGLPKVIEFMNLWAREAPKIKDFMVARYEDLRARPEDTLQRVLQFLGTPATGAQIADAVAFASYDNMKQMEQQRVFWLSGGRLVPKDRSNPNSYKVRRGKVAGYRDDFDAAQLARIDRLVETTLDPLYGYARAATDTAKGTLEGAA